MAENPLERPAREIFAARGFKRRSPYGLFLKPLAEGINAWVGLNRGSGPGWISLTPTVGVRHEQVQYHMTRLLGRDPKKSTAPTVQTTLMFLIPRERKSPQWLFVKDEDQSNTATWELLGRDIDQYATPWMLERSTPTQLIAALRRHEGLETSRLGLPVLLWLTGDPDGAREAIEAGRQIRNITGMVVDYNSYAERLHAEIDAHPDGPREPAPHPGHRRK